MSDDLGTELDITLGYKISNEMVLNGGYSKMFATESMEILKGGDMHESNSWVWLMVTFKPKLFNSSNQ